MKKRFLFRLAAFAALASSLMLAVAYAAGICDHSAVAAVIAFELAGIVCYGCSLRK
nr:MAG TPA: protein of unknown function (DUF4972) [Caudoviricetes sp.]